ncbi:MAG: diaminopimelate epimerase, partial [Acidobacteria bacterium]|nr:diaminopimelate epimerase [Acidobacteriota bacterium]
MRVDTEFAKLHALGNDFLVMRLDQAGEQGVSMAALARRMCDRHRGIGADGILYYQPTIGDGDADVSCLIFNADGSKAEMSGNGVRCLAAFLALRHEDKPQALRVRTVSGIRTCMLRSRQGRICTFETAMGIPVTAPPLVPCTLGSASEPLLDHPVIVDGCEVAVTVLSMGNPHCVTFWPQAADAPLASLGPQLERHHGFPKGTNVEFVEVVNRRRLRVRFWERGVGLTSSSGTGSSAAAAAAILRQAADSPLAVETDGGELTVSWNPPGEVLLTGSAEFICS